MSTTATGELVLAAHASGHGVAAFNVITLEHAEAIATAAERAGLPVILQISENAVKFHGGRLEAVLAAAAAVAPECRRARRPAPGPCGGRGACCVRASRPASPR